MQVVSSQTDAGDPVQWRRILAQGIGFLSVLLAGSALVFWIASNWPQMSPDGRLRLVQGVLALLVCVTTGLAWRGSPWAEHAAGLAALATGALLALMGQIYQTGADAWELFFAWAMLLLPWLVLLRSAVLALLWVLLLNLTYVTWAGTSSILWWGDWFGLALMLLNGALLAPIIDLFEKHGRISHRAATSDTEFLDFDEWPSAEAYAAFKAEAGPYIEKFEAAFGHRSTDTVYKTVE